MKCIIVDTEILAIDLIESYLNRIECVEVVGKFNNSLDTIPLLNKNSVDLIFLAIEMPFLNGFELAKKIGRSSQFIFISTNTKYYIDAYKMNATDYLVKPLSFNSFIRAVSKAKNRYKQEGPHSINISSAGSGYTRGPDKNILIQTESKTLTMDIDEIKYIQSYKKSNKIYTRNSSKPIVTSSSVENILVNLPDYFLQVHKSFIVNTCLIQAIQKRRVIVGGMPIPLGKAYENSVSEHLICN